MLFSSLTPTAQIAALANVRADMQCRVDLAYSLYRNMPLHQRINTKRYKRMLDVRRTNGLRTNPDWIKLHLGNLTEFTPSGVMVVFATKSFPPYSVNVREAGEFFPYFK